MKHRSEEPVGEGWSLLSLPDILVQDKSGRRVSKSQKGTPGRVLSYMCYHGGEAQKENAIVALGITDNNFRVIYKRLRSAFRGLLDEEPGYYRPLANAQCDAWTVRQALHRAHVSDVVQKYEVLRPTFDLYQGPFASGLNGLWESRAREEIHGALDRETKEIVPWLRASERLGEAVRIRSLVISNIAVAQGLVRLADAKDHLSLLREAGDDVLKVAKNLATGFNTAEAVALLAHAPSLLHPLEDPPLKDPPPEDDPPEEEPPGDGPPWVKVGLPPRAGWVPSPPVRWALGAVVFVVVAFVVWPRPSATPPASPNVPPPPVYAQLMDFWVAADQKDFHAGTLSSIPPQDRGEIDALLLQRADELVELPPKGEGLLGLLSPAKLSIDTIPVQSLAFAPDGNTLYSGHGDLTLLVPNIAPYTSHKDPKANVAKLARDQDWPICEWDLNSSSKPRRMLAHGNAVLTLTISPDGERLLSTGRDGKAFVWDRATGREIAELVQPPYREARPPYTISTSEIAGACFVSDREVLTTVQDGLLRWKLPSTDEGATLLRKINPEPRIQRKNADGKDVVFSTVQSNADQVLTSGGDNVVHLWSQAIDRPRDYRFGGDRDVAFPAIFSPDGRRIAAGDTDHDVRVWDVKEPQKPTLVLRGLDVEVHALAFSATGKRLVTGDLRGRISVWDLTTGRRLLQLVCPNVDEIRAVAIAPNDAALAVACLDGSIFLWRLKDPPSSAAP